MDCIVVAIVSQCAISMAKVFPFFPVFAKLIYDVNFAEIENSAAILRSREVQRLTLFLQAPLNVT